MSSMDDLIRSAAGYGTPEEAHAAHQRQEDGMDALIRAAAGVPREPDATVEPPATSFDGGAREPVPVYVDPSEQMNRVLRAAFAVTRGL